MLTALTFAGSDPSSKSIAATPVESKDQKVQTSLGRNSTHHKLEDIYAAEEGAVSHSKPLIDKPTPSKGFKFSKLFKPGKKTSGTENNNTVLTEGYPTVPQTFLVKYMGNRPCKGYGGAKYIQTPVEEVVEAVNQLSKGSDLPLVKLEVTVDGLNMTPHKRNKVKPFESVSIPIQYISYGSQDQKYPRIFCFIMVREMSARSKKLDCHVYACDSSKSARKAAGCLALAFQVYQDKLQGQPAQYAAYMSSATSQYLEDDMKSSYEA